MRGSAGADQLPLLLVGSHMDRKNKKTQSAPETGPAANIQASEGASQREAPTEAKKRRNRCGAEKKRARAARLAANQPQTQPSQPAEGDPRPTTSGTKRGRVHGDTPPSVKKQQVTKKAPAATYSGATQAALRVAIVGPETVKLSQAMTYGLQECLSRQIDALPEGTLPRFDEFRQSEQGIILVTCSDTQSKEWLTTAVEALSPFQGTPIRMVERGLLPKLLKMFAFVPGAPVDRESIMGRIKRSNPGLNTQNWILREVIAVPGKGSRLILHMEEKSVRDLKARNNIGYAGMARISFWDPRSAKTAKTPGPPEGSVSAEPEQGTAEPAHTGGSEEVTEVELVKATDASEDSPPMGSAGPSGSVEPMEEEPPGRRGADNSSNT